MSTRNSNGNEHSNVVPILRAIFPELPEEDLQLIDLGFGVLLQTLYVAYKGEQEQLRTGTSHLDGKIACDSLK